MHCSWAGRCGSRRGTPERSSGTRVLLKLARKCQSGETSSGMILDVEALRVIHGFCVSFSNAKWRFLCRPGTEMTRRKPFVSFHLPAHAVILGRLSPDSLLAAEQAQIIARSYLIWVQITVVWTSIPSLQTFRRGLTSTRNRRLVHSRSLTLAALYCWCVWQRSSTTADVLAARLKKTYLRSQCSGPLHLQQGFVKEFCRFHNWYARFQIRHRQGALEGMALNPVVPGQVIGCSRDWLAMLRLAPCKLQVGHVRPACPQNLLLTLKFCNPSLVMPTAFLMECWFVLSNAYET